jgi:hypothetical protein
VRHTGRTVSAGAHCPADEKGMAMMNEGTPHVGGPGDIRASSDDRQAFDTSVAHQARIYDYWLGGKDNYAADRKAADEAIAAYPGVVTGARANRQFLARAVRHLAADAASGSFSTSVPASRPRATPTRSPRRRHRSPAWSTWITTRSCWPTRGPC